jgi:hypothetical protein
LSLSVPFFELSVQLGAAQEPLLQTLLRQSLATLHFLLLAHLSGQLPPQSTSVSMPS